MLKESTIKTCRVCGKKFYCSYGCYRKAGGDNGKWKMSTK